ncbi:glycoside hydrolase [Dactylosporangium sp. NBC_01737]|uniref:sialidase family protein n=1 Tax=Dactylosporangium sp. NBC_01737 TaxID=2975959 RepID=UPI002E10AEE2|nr:glycoside hydrolase [Dactylosporangium sp. NBC_01737]
MSSLRERFDDAVASPTPPNLAGGEEVYATAWRRRRVRNRVVSAVVAGCTAAVVAAVAMLVTSGGHDRGMPTPAENGSVPATGNERPYYSDGLVEEAVATDLNHLYALQLRCTSTDPGSCGRVLYGSEDGGRTWTQRKPGSPYQLRVLAPGVLGGLSMTSPTSAVARYSSDGGRTWKDTELASGTIAAVPPGGWPTCREGNDGTTECAVHGVDAQTGAETKLATQPPVILPTGLEQTPANTGLWVSGYVPQSNRTGVSVSRDGGLTWSTYVFGKDEADYPQGINNQQVRIATVDGITAHAVVSVVTDNGQNRLLVYRTGDGGLTWQRTDPRGTLPWLQHGDSSFVAADGTHVVQAVVSNPADWYAGTTGAYTKPAPVTGLDGVDDMRQPVQTVAAGAYLLFDRSAVYVSPDGLHWTRHPVQPS